MNPVGGRRGPAGRARVTAGLVALLLRRRAAGEMRRLTAGLARALRDRLDAPVDVRDLARALCAEMSRRRGGRPVDLRFERFPDELEVTGLWLEFEDFDLVIVEERAEAVQQLVILGHELWHMRQGHRDHHVTGAAALPALSGGPGTGTATGVGTRIALTVAARDGSHAAEEAQAEDFGVRLAGEFRSWVRGAGTGRGTGKPVGPAGLVGPAGETVRASQ
ncbi:toxin-antitoxin system, toxin component [Streptomyces sp. NPDC059785]|uniref:toxin-antitoxin system, toxin component n=1 Tax=Streptomyces sp. NPDC059785 TaxID=3346945 RepID=UPI003646471D